MSEASGAALGRVQHIGRLPLGLFVTCNDHLCYPLAIVNDEGLGGEVCQNHANLAAIVGIDTGDAALG